MRRHNRGVRGMDIALTMSYDITTGIMCGILLGCCSEQQTFIRQQLQSLREMARHPLLLPILLIGQQQLLLSTETEALWMDLLRVENASGQTGVVVVSANAEESGHRWALAARPREAKKDAIGTKLITNKVLGVVQLASVWDSHNKALKNDLEAIHNSMMDVEKAASSHLNVCSEELAPTPKPCIGGKSTPGRNTTLEKRVSKISEISMVLAASLTVISSQSSSVSMDLAFINTRAAAQMTAVSPPTPCHRYPG